jgi:hypothetical protein
VCSAENRAQEHSDLIAASFPWRLCKREREREQGRADPPHATRGFLHPFPLLIALMLRCNIFNEAGRTPTRSTMKFLLPSRTLAPQQHLWMKWTGRQTSSERVNSVVS